MPNKQASAGSAKNKKGKKKEDRGRGGKSKGGSSDDEPAAKRRDSSATSYAKKKGIWFPEGSPTANIIQSLNLTKKDLLKLRRQYSRIDLDDSGEIDMEEFFAMFKEKPTPYSRALFELTDIDGSGTIEFDEFIQILCSYCVYSKEDILSFCFDTFDKDGSGEIDEQEYLLLMKGLADSNPMFPGNFQKALQQFGKCFDTSSLQPAPRLTCGRLRLQTLMTTG